MPRKTITTESRAINRANQQKSRARKAALIADLRRQVTEHQRLGARASQELQTVARALAKENRQLKTILLRFMSKSELEMELENRPGHMQSLQQSHSCPGPQTITVSQANVVDTVPSTNHSMPTQCRDPLQTECTLAARILASMHSNSHLDETELRSALGCTDSGSCTVKNSHIFTLMDSA